MVQYTQEDTLRIAKRYQNAKRSYLLVNPLQAKHMPVSPSQALHMMETLGQQIAENYPGAKLVIGFAETATAIGAVVAGCLGNDCSYVQTTREDFPVASAWFDFAEEHSHAVEQRLCREGFGAWLGQTDVVVLVDDEISTGKTLINMVNQIKQSFPELSEKTIVAASVLNRVSEENNQKLLEAGIVCEYLVKLPQDDYTAMVEPFDVREGRTVTPVKLPLRFKQLPCRCEAEPRTGVSMQAYQRDCEALADAFITAMMLAPEIENQRILVLGTEECMFPALTLGKKLEDSMPTGSVRCHATTRSPIGICGEQGYPIQSGCRLRSFYDSERVTYLYNIQEYDMVIVVSDTPVENLDALESLAAALNLQSNTKLFYLQGGQNVWYI